MIISKLIIVIEYYKTCMDNTSLPKKINWFECHSSGKCSFRAIAFYIADVNVNITYIYRSSYGTVMTANNMC